MEQEQRCEKCGAILSVQGCWDHFSPEKLIEMFGAEAVLKELARRVQQIEEERSKCGHNRIREILEGLLMRKGRKRISGRSGWFR